MSDTGGQMTEVFEFGLRPVGATRAYAPEGMRKAEWQKDSDLQCASLQLSKLFFAFQKQTPQTH